MAQRPVRRFMQGWYVFKRLEDASREFYPRGYEYEPWDGPYLSRAEAELIFREDRGVDSYWHDEPSTKSPTFVVGRNVIEIPMESRAIRALRVKGTK